MCRQMEECGLMTRKKKNLVPVVDTLKKNKAYMVVTYNHQAVRSSLVNLVVVQIIYYQVITIWHIFAQFW